MEEQVIKEDKKFMFMDCKEIIHIKKEEQKPPCYQQYHTTFIKEEFKAEKLDHKCACAESSMTFTDYSVVKNHENDSNRLPLSNYETFYDKLSLDVRSKSENISSFLNTGVKFQSFVCVLCNAKLIDYKQLTTHIEYHLNEQTFIKESNYQEKQHQCHLCVFTTSQKKYLKIHIDSIHKKLKPYKCHLCAFTTSQKSNLNTHIQCIHKKLKPHKCHICDYTAAKKESLKLHIDGKHKNLKPYKCHLCVFRTSAKCTLKMHIDSVHKQLKPHKCHICDYTAARKGSLKLHIDGKHKNLKPHKCHICDYSTLTEVYLKKHIDGIHTRLKPHKRRDQCCAINCSNGAQAIDPRTQSRVRFFSFPNPIKEKER